MTVSTEVEYKQLPLPELGLATVSFQNFGYLREKDIDKICDTEGVPWDQIAEIRRIWIIHPERRQQTPHRSE
jgi:hypothetical protein